MGHAVKSPNAGGAQRPGRASRAHRRYPPRMPEDFPPRIVTLVLVRRGWQRPGPTRRPSRSRRRGGRRSGRSCARRATRFGIDVTVLRLLDAERPSAHGGAVTYLAEVEAGVLADAGGRPASAPWSGTLDRRSPPSRLTPGPAGRPRTSPGRRRASPSAGGLALDGRPVQVRTWNLSSLWRIPHEGRSRVAQGRSGLLRARGRGPGAPLAGRRVPDAPGP